MNIQYLSDELFIGIMYFLPITTVIRCSTVCKRWKQVFSDTLYWDQILNTQFSYVKTLPANVSAPAKDLSRIILSWRIKWNGSAHMRCPFCWKHMRFSVDSSGYNIPDEMEEQIYATQEAPLTLLCSRSKCGFCVELASNCCLCQECLPKTIKSVHDTEPISGESTDPLLVLCFGCGRICCQSHLNWCPNCEHLHCTLCKGRSERQCLRCRSKKRVLSSLQACPSRSDEDSDEDEDD
eukprot:TRINITY_DN12680_c0_g1_i1.p1 TRINITY_DN12680_c0_g1~~TRINITY_DN12680_c0_g1_i1.p1  ORF type:complete len:237 (-),score=9.82 TRINITY_DN12680_c0_g1_i1:14-724(-)